MILPVVELRRSSFVLPLRREAALVRIALGLAILGVFLGHAAKFYQIGSVTRLDHLLHDTRLRLMAPGTVDNRIVILDVDERSLATPGLGRWARGRDVVAGLAHKLFDR